jgi:hypothetical protein
MARKLPEELAERVTLLFPVSDANPGSAAIHDQVEKGGLALPHLMRIYAQSEITPQEVLALVKALETYSSNYAFLLKDALKAKAETLRKGEPWGTRNPDVLQRVFQLADECEAMLEAQGLNDHPIATAA